MPFHFIISITWCRGTFFFFWFLIYFIPPPDLFFPPLVLSLLLGCWLFGFNEAGTEQTSSSVVAPACPHHRSLAFGSHSFSALLVCVFLHWKSDYCESRRMPASTALWLKMRIVWPGLLSPCGVICLMTTQEETRSALSPVLAALTLCHSLCRCCQHYNTCRKQAFLSSRLKYPLSQHPTTLKHMSDWLHRGEKKVEPRASWINTKHFYQHKGKVICVQVMKEQVAADNRQWLQCSHSSLMTENQKVTNKQSNNLPR